MRMSGLYIHIPFCKKKCAYCDFASYAGCEALADGYIDALGREAEKYRGAKVDTVFIGGGTPTFLDCAQLGRVFDIIYKNFNIAENAEITTEANPGTADKEKLRLLKECGVNRISIGVQSFDDDELKLLGRIHTAEQAYGFAYSAAEIIGNFNLDIMTALPYQTRYGLLRTVDRALTLTPPHLSCYSLILEEGTPLCVRFADGHGIPDEDADRDMFAALCERVEQSGLRRYEISNFARPGYECRHNLKYWECREYIGLGAAAHSYDGNVRYANTAVLEEYISGAYTPEVNTLSEKDKMGEFMMLGLRLTRGVSEAEFAKRFGESIKDVYGDKPERFCAGGLMIRSGGRLRLSPRGMDVSNGIMAEFI